MAEDQSISMHAAPAGGGSPLVLPHRGLAIVCLAVLSAAVLPAAAAAWALPRIGDLLALEWAEVLDIVCVALVAVSVTAAVAAWIMATSDLRRMAEGRMDPAGKAASALGKAVAMLVTLGLAAAAIYGIVLVLTTWGE